MRHPPAIRLTLVCAAAAAVLGGMARPGWAVEPAHTAVAPAVPYGAVPLRTSVAESRDRPFGSAAPLASFAV